MVSNFRVIQIGGAPIQDEENYIKKLLNQSSIDSYFEMWGLRNDVEQILRASDI